MSQAAHNHLANYRCSGIGQPRPKPPPIDENLPPSPAKDERRAYHHAHDHKVRHPFSGQPKLAADMRVLVGSLLTSVGRIESGDEEAELGKFPVLLLRCFGEGDLPVSFIASFCNDLEEFVVSASDLLDTLDRVLLREKMQSANGAPT